jgi:hypothetical protein
MTLQMQMNFTIPEETVRVACAGFPAIAAYSALSIFD